MLDLTIIEKQKLNHLQNPGIKSQYKVKKLRIKLKKLVAFKGTS
jgi:hypothetical protein